MSQSTPVAKTLTRVLVGLQISLAGAGLLYRSTLYHRLPVARGEPYGIGDVIDLLFYFVLLASSVLTLFAVAVFIALPSWRRRASIIALLLAALLPLPIYYVLHARLPRIW